MEERKIYEDLSVVLKRAHRTFWLIAVLVLLVLGYYWKTQILNFQRYWDLAEANPARSSVLTAPRGLIRDRNGRILVENRASYKVSLTRDLMKDYPTGLGDVARFLGIELGELSSRIDRYRSIPVFEPIVVKDNLDFENDVPRIMGRQLEFPELSVETEPQRFYPYRELAAHVLGYLQERTPEEIRRTPERHYHPGDMGGKAGIESRYDEILSGWNGAVFEVVDSLGKKRGVFDRREAVEGEDVYLTLDFGLQELVEKILKGREGSVVVMDTTNGEILAMASYPTFDPNRFISRFTPDEWRELINDPASPLENRTIRGLYAPGSIFKLVMGLAGLEFKLVTTRTTFFCSGVADFYGTPRHCWFEPGHGAMNLANAIKNSCNIYFYNLGRQLGIDNIAAIGGRIGLAETTGVDIDGEKSGQIPHSKWKKDAPWYPGETISVAIGQGPILVTPLEVAVLTAIVGNRGVRVTPHLFLRMGGDDSLEQSEDLAKKENVEISPSSFESIIEGMWRSVNDGGTGSGAYVPGMEICGKTGSTQLISRETAERLARAGREIKTHSWFSGFAPRDNPRYVVTVLVEYGGGGGALAAPLGGEIFRALREQEK